MNNLKTLYLSIYVVLLLIVGNSFAIEIEKSPNDPREYVYLKLDNGLRLIVVSDPMSQHNACSLEVKAGSFDEPDNIPGLAHFVEHVLFLGTKSYPKPDEFKHVIDRNGGGYNALTGSNFTRFYFTIHPAAFENSLSMFSSFFIEPLFNPEYLDRERNAVDAEYKMNIKSDAMKVFDVNKQTSNPKHPFHRFNVGNIDTLSKQKFNLQQQAIMFFEQHYAPSQMTLSLVGPQSTEYLLNLAKHYFSKIPERSFVTKKYPLAFQNKHKKIDLGVKTEAPYNQMTLMFVLSKFDQYHKEKPLSFVTSLSGSKDKSSLYHYLKEKNWINDLSVSEDTVLDNQDILTMTLSLTSSGSQHTDDITKAFFEYVNFIKKSGYSQDFYNDLKAISALHWKYYQPENCITLAAKITENLHKYPPEKVLSYDFEFDAPNYEMNQHLINSLLSEISVKNMRRITLSSEIKGEKETPWYHANYTVQKLPKIKSACEDFKRGHSVFSFPEKNAFIPENFDIVALDKNKKIKIPKKITTNTADKLWFVHDDKFKEPTATIFINLATNMTTLTPKHVILTDLFANLVVDSLQEEFYPAGFTGASLSFYGHARGIGIKLFSYSDKQTLLVKRIFEKFREYEIDPVKFFLVKDKVERNYKKVYQKSLHEQTNMCLYSLINRQNYHVDELINAIKQVNIEDLNQFVNSLRKDFNLEVLVNGNHSVAEAKNMLQLINIENDMNKTVLPLNTVKLSPGKTYFKLLKADRDNHVLNWYFQNSESSDAMAARTVILERLISNPFFANLRTKQQLGYAVYTQTYVNNKVSGLILCIESPHEPKVILEKVRAFLKEYRREITKVSASDLEQIKVALINNISQPPKSLSEQSEQFFWPIQTGILDFDYREKTIKAIRSVSLNDIVQLYDTIISEKTGQLIIATNNPIEHKNIVVLKDWQELKDILS